MTDQSTRRGRHASARTTRDPRLVAVLLVVALVAVVGLGVLVTWVAGRDAAASASDDVAAASAEPLECEEPIRLDVVADPAVSGTVTTVLEDLECVDARVSAQASDVTADAVARPEGVGLGGALPDVWIPSSSLWVAQARSTEAGAARVAQDPVSLASSPVVLAAAADAEPGEGWSGSEADWLQLMEGGSVRVASGDPRTDAPALAAMLAATSGDPSPQTVAAMSAKVSVPASQGRSPAQMVLEDVADVMPTSELDVIRTQESGDRQGTLRSAYDTRLGALDFPLVVVTGEESDSAEGSADDVAAAAEVARAELLGEEAAAAFAALGLRTGGGELDERYRDGYGVDARAREAEAVVADGVTAGLDAWAVAGRRARILLVVDRSGSMRRPLPDGTVPKSALARDSVVQVVASASPDTELGLWSFTTDGDEAEIDRLAPMAPLSAQSTGATHRERLTTAVTGLQPRAVGDTPLFQVVLDAYEEAQENYAWGRLNAVVVVTDGRNDHPSGTLTEDETLDQLRLLYDGMRPVRILALGYGPETDLEGLTRLADVTGGQAFQGLTEAEAATLLERTLPEL
ncbi:VWA domain-containing protein [Nostocoides sp. F2B08]|uniref:VWA domain-containing protein n=1 Tax=Nostocoides sp. F2B08 TaxID=2653936 RepID=UPI001263DB69|nr:VWA domain-containing protein [Tetrasphaera sp. F2B08]KAB7746478.1 VWA domain-containing protein [Tetrasphaera sp. F2B08]